MLARLRVIRAISSRPLSQGLPEYGEIVVVHKRTVLVRASDAVDAEAAFLARGEEAEVIPEARGLDQDLRAITPKELIVATDLHILSQGICDIGIDMILRGASGIVGEALYH